MSKYLVIFVVCLAFVALTHTASLAEDNSENETQQEEVAASVDPDEGLVEAELIKSIRLGRLAELMLKQLRFSSQRYAGVYGEDADEPLAAAAVVEKRFPKWRSGETRSKVRLLHDNDKENGRKAWEKNLAEKNKLYQTLLG